MKKLLCVLLAVVGWCGAQAQAADNEIRDDKIYLFYSEGCPHCKHAEAYLAQNYPNLEMERLNVGTRYGYYMFVECVKKFDLGSEVGTPLFCMGDNYLMGWDDSYPEKFKRYLKPFEK